MSSMNSSSRPNHNQNGFMCVIDRLENGRAVLRFSDRQELVVPRRYLPRDASEGMALELQFFTEESATKKQEDLARAMLKEILGG